MGSTEQKTLQSILQAIIDQGNATVTQVNGQIASGTGNLEVVKDLKLQELVGATANHTITLEAKAQELIQLISEQGLRIRINQPAHGFLFNPVQFDTTANKYVKATVSTGADAMAIRVTDDFFDLVSSGSYVIPQGAVDSKGAEFVIDDFYFLDATGAGLIARDEPIRYYQPLFLVYSDRGIKTASINVNPMVDKLAQIVMPDGLNGFQLEEDMRLHTEAKSVVGGINELKSRADGLELEVEQNKSDILLKLDKGSFTGNAGDLFPKTGGLITGEYHSNANSAFAFKSIRGDYESMFGVSNTIGDCIFGIKEKKALDYEHYIRVGPRGFYFNTKGSQYDVFSTLNCIMLKEKEGWIKFANGLIIQWGGVDTPSREWSGDNSIDVGTINFKIAFSNPLPRIITQTIGNLAIYPRISSRNATGFNVFGDRYRPTSAIGVFSYMWIAIGY